MPWVFLEPAISCMFVSDPAAGRQPPDTNGRVVGAMSKLLSTCFMAHIISVLRFTENRNALRTGDLVGDAVVDGLCAYMPYFPLLVALVPTQTFKVTLGGLNAPVITSRAITPASPVRILRLSRGCAAPTECFV